MRLMLLRHAKAEKAPPGMRDRDRGLTGRGQRDAAKIADYMVRHGLQPDRILVSGAARTRETWQCMERAFAAAPVEYEDRLYESGPDAILAVIRELGQSASALLAIGHNPGLQDTARLLVAARSRGAGELEDNLPTSGLVVIDFAGKSWRGLALRSGRIEHFMTPRFLKAGKT
ncbi:MAG: histidine phosphatase family protein [Alphaproteobacteria bacterium]|nr:histidine phosphatase family protein [Alphaproteobacteria bacterium]